MHRPATTYSGNCSSSAWAGIDKDDATRARLKKLNDQLTNDQLMFERNIADGQNTIEVADASELDGLPQDYIENHKPGADGKIHITTNYPDIFPPLKYSKSDALRHLARGGV